MRNIVLIVGAGQAGLAAARAVSRAGLRPVVMEASGSPGGSWAHYYDSLTLFSPARFSELPGLRFPGDRDRYPRRDEVVSYLRQYAQTLEAEIHTNQRVSRIELERSPVGAGRFVAHAESGETFEGAGLVSASGGFSRPFTPDIPGLATFTGTVLHSSEYRTPDPYVNQRVVVVGAGNSAAQVAVELAEHADVTIASRAPLTFADPILLGRDLHWWVVKSRLDALPLGPWLASPPKQPVVDQDRYYSSAITAGRPARRPMFTSLDGNEVTWADGTTEAVDVIIFATGYRPNLDYLAPLGALDPAGTPHHRAGVSTTVPGLGFVGMEWQRSFGSATLRGVARDAAYVARRLRATWAENRTPSSSTAVDADASST